MNDIISKIASRGYWKVIMHPSEFKKDRLETLLECQKLIEDCKVSLRGWDYPHFLVGKEDIISAADYVWSTTDWEMYKEYWRFYQSGQFVHYFGCAEDWWRGSKLDANLGKQYEPGEVLELTMVLYRLTEIYEFASRLAQKRVFGEQMWLEIELHGMQNRRLISLDKPFFGTFGPYVSQETTLKFETLFTVQDLIATAAEKALEQSLKVFERFNWRDARIPESVTSLRMDQRKLLERRF
jgi:hypothetical protein